jgi:hypothetical protein
MPQYTIRDPKTGRTVELRGDSPPTPGELEVIFAKINTDQPAHQPAQPAAPEQGMLSKAVNFGLDAIVGAGKGAARTAVGAGRLVQMIPGVTRLTGEIPEGAESALGLDPTNTAQRVGMGVEQAAEFFLPGGALRRAPAVAKLISRAPTAGRATAEGLIGGGVSALQGGDVTTGAAFGLAGPLAGKAVGAAASRAGGVASRLNTQARTQIGQALDPTTRRMKAKTTRITPEIQKRGMTGSREAILSDATDKAAALGKQIDTELVIAGKRPIDLADARRRLAAMKGATFEMVPQSSGPAKQVIHDPRKYTQIEKLESILDGYGDTMNVRQATAIRRTWDAIVERAGGFDDKAKGAPFGMSLDDASEASVVRDGVAGLRKALAKAVPEVKDINKEFGFWSDLRDVLQATQLRHTGQKRGMFRKIMAAGGTASGAVVGSGAGPQGAAAGAVLAGTLADKAEKMFASPQWKLLSAKYKTKLADAIASANPQRIQVEFARVGQALNALKAGTGVPSVAGAR